MKTKLCMVDFDGTLCNTTEVNYFAYKQALNDEGFDITYDFYRNECNGKDYRQFIPQIIGDNVDLLRVIHDKKLTYYKRYIAKAKLNYDLVKHLEEIKPNTHIALVTAATRKNCNEMLIAFGLRDIFDLVITKEDVVNIKPHPEGYLKAIKHFEIEKDKCIIYEDSEQGIKAAQAAGVKYVVVKGYN